MSRNIFHILESEIDSLRAVRAALLAALKDVEWVGSSDREYCPWCANRQIDGHAKDCARQTVIRQAEGKS